jgi:hypothetical protein
MRIPLHRSSHPQTLPLLQNILDINTARACPTRYEDFAYGFSSILPALAFSLDMFVKTDNSYGVNEVLLASVLGCVFFSLFAAQPLVIVGITGKSST